MGEARLTFQPTREQVRLARLATRACQRAGLLPFTTTRTHPTKQQRAVACYDCIAHGWTWTELARVCKTSRASVKTWVREAELLGTLNRARLRLELLRSDTI